MGLPVFSGVCYSSALVWIVRPAVSHGVRPHTCRIA